MAFHDDFLATSTGSTGPRPTGGKLIAVRVADSPAFLMIRKWYWTTPRRIVNVLDGWSPVALACLLAAS
jgi:hypothetical protein